MVPASESQASRALPAPLEESSWNRATVAEEPSDPLLGATLSETYVVERAIGEGGMGRVYLARHTRIAQKRVALKVLRPEYANHREVLARFQREAEAAASVSHPNVVTVLDIGRTASGLPYLVCEYLEGRDLSEHLADKGKLDVPSALHIIKQVCKGLAAAHASGVVHRDLKPHNVFLVGDFTSGAPARPAVKILDFGLSRFLQTTPESQLTQSGAIMGTPAYMAPEQARAQPVDRRADVYGTGAILYAALTGRPPFVGETAQETVLAVLNQEPPPPRSLEPSIPVPLEIILERALAREPADRFADALSLEIALEAFESRLYMESLPPRMPILPDQASSVHFPSQLSVAPLEGNGPDPAETRVLLLFFALCGFGLFFSAAMTCVPGVELAVGRSFTSLETALLLAAATAGAAALGVLWFTRVRRRVVNGLVNTARLLSDVRATVITFLLAYGFSVLALQAVDGGLVRLFGTARIAPAGATWPGWNLLLPLVAGVAAGGQLWLRRVASRVRAGWRRLLAIWSVASLLVMLVGSLVVLGLHWRELSTKAPPTGAVAPARR